MRPVEILIDGTWYSTADLTGDELEAIEKATGVSWYVVNPFSSMVHFRAVAGAFMVRLGKSDDEIRSIIGSMTAAQLDACSRLAPEGEGLPDAYEDGIPLAAAAPSTPTS